MKFRVTYRCKHCGCTFKRVVKDIASKQPRCPNLACKKQHQDIGFDPTGPAPAIGGSIVGKAVDMTAEIVMQDHGMTDLRDNIREGDIAAPKLPGIQQQLADTMFTPSKNPMFAGRRGRQMEALGRRAIAGAFRNQALDVKGVLPDNRVGLRVLRTEPLKRG